VKTLGLVGGIGPESTIAYYRAIMAAARAGPPGREQPPILITSIDVQKVLRLAGTHALPELTEYLVEEVERLAKAAADLALLAANTPHIVFDDVRSQVSIPMVSIVEATREVARAMGLQRLGLFGTRFTMQGHFYPDVFSKAGLEIVPPRDEEQAFIHDKYVNELSNGTFAGSTRDALLRLVDAQRARDRIAHYRRVTNAAVRDRIKWAVIGIIVASVGVFTNQALAFVLSNQPGLAPRVVMVAASAVQTIGWFALLMIWPRSLPSMKSKTR
jgi:aspartate racemase